MTFDERLKHGEQLIKDDNYKDAFDVYCDLYYERPENTEFLKTAHFLFKRMREAYIDFEPTTANDFLFRGVAKFYDGDIQSSNSDYDKAITLNPNMDIAHYYKSINFRENGENEKAIKEVEKAIAKNPNCDYYDELAENLFRLGRIKECLNYHEIAIGKAPSNQRLLFNYGVHLGKAGLIANAVIKLQEAIEIDPNYDDARIALGYYYQKLGNL